MLSKSHIENIKITYYRKFNSRIVIKKQHKPILFNNSKQNEIICGSIKCH